MKNFSINPFKSSLMVDSVLSVWQAIPAPAIHNLQKARALKMLFWHCAVDQVAGNYIEFGVAHGHSMRAASLAEKSAFSKTIGVKRIPRKLYGFDTFSEFISESELDAHSTWEGSLFNLPLEVIERRFRRNPNISFVKCDVSTLATKKSFIKQEDFDIEGKSAIVLFDMDLYAPTLAALRWVKQSLQQGTFLIFDEYFSFAGDSRKGESLAFSEFLKENPQIEAREVDTYGAGGKIFVISNC